MKKIQLNIGDTLVALVNDPFNAPIRKNDRVEIVRFGHGNTYRTKEYGYCPVVKDIGGDEWHTDMKELFHNFKKETK